jgi:hypothetical protein
MTTYNTTAVANLQGANAHGLSGNAKVAYGEVAVTTALSTSDTLNMFDLPAKARIVMAVLESDDIDTNGTPTVTLNVGDSGSATRLFSASTVGQAGTASTALAVTGVGYKTTATTRIKIVPQANPATAAAGTIRLAVVYVVE